VRHAGEAAQRRRNGLLLILGGLFLWGFLLVAVVIGVVVVLGGVGGVTGTAVGVLFIGTLQNGLSISGVSSFWQQVVTGVILILAIAIDMLQQSPGGRLRRLRGVGHGPTSTSEPTLEEGQPR
jgi:branched-subunit amino acid ABC-type transport system permease component